jgi:type II secretory ATPase GspE/PulE/Tfp pilus assembly ATPase PilB-like protein
MLTEKNVRHRWLDAGLSQAQWDAIHTQYVYMQSHGKPTGLAELIARTRFLTAEQIRQGVGVESDSPGTASEQLLPVSLCRQYRVFPAGVNGGTLRLIAAGLLTPSQRSRILRECARTVHEISVVPTDHADMQNLLRAFDEKQSIEDLVNQMRNEDISAPLLKSTIQLILTEALYRRTSDIHLDRKPDPDSWISYRIDSEIKQSHLIPEFIMAAIFTVIKNESGMDAANQRSAQDGRMSIKYRDRNVDFRVASQPLVDGETLTLRILDGGNLPALGDIFPGQVRIANRISELSKVKNKSGGIIIISGATGSGKSTTLYTLASSFSRDRINIITVEDPVEYILPYARQIQLQALVRQQSRDMERSILRQDPDILILGEIRDSDSASTALAFAESGHLVLCTIHANNALQTIERFMSMVDEGSKGDSLFVLAHHLKMIVHQKLAKSLCKCAKSIDLERLRTFSDSVTQATEGLLKAGPASRKRNGCPICQNSGYRGRVAVHETLMVEENDQLREDFSAWMMQGDFGSATPLRDMRGVDFIHRTDTASTLLEGGIIDAETAMAAVGILRNLDTGDKT